ncbi:protein of unknown function (plasmid) [Cupriavidus taiwanensis]|nr:protein of unknown function [Cupriavidus taiwanensis]SPA57470.1 protein of unknown function [Cupriavidus taiwanensis]
MRPIHLLALLPAAGVLTGPFFLNRVTPRFSVCPFCWAGCPSISYSRQL